jgi:hypothetical protein
MTKSAFDSLTEEMYRLLKNPFATIVTEKDDCKWCLGTKETGHSNKCEWAKVMERECGS